MDANSAEGIAKTVSLRPLMANFDLGSLRSWAEAEIDQLIRKNEDLMQRLAAFEREREHARVQMFVHWMTDGYRVDEAITPRLFRLSSLAGRILRLVQPIDLFICNSPDQNACCLPSQKGNRLIVCLHSGLVSLLGSQELLFVIGHEVGHAVLKFGHRLGISFDNPDFSPLEVLAARAHDRAHEVSCDRFGLLACQDVRAACSALFKIATGLDERWMSFNETAYARHFDDMAKWAELISVNDPSSTHPLIPMRVKALVDFSKSESYATAFGWTDWEIPTVQMEGLLNTMLSVLDPRDIWEEYNKGEEGPTNQFLLDGALLLIAADGAVSPDEIGWLAARTKDAWSAESLAQGFSQPEFLDQLRARVEENASFLRKKVPPLKRAGLLQVMFDIALRAGGITQAESQTLHKFCELLQIPPEVANKVYHRAVQESEDATHREKGTPQPAQRPAEPETPDSCPPADVLEAIVERAKLPATALARATEVCDQIRSQNLPPPVAARALVAWAITASRSDGPLSDTQGKKMAVAAIKVCREIQRAAGVARKYKSPPADRLVRQHGVVALFRRGEKIGRGADNKPHVIISVSKANGCVVVAPEDNLTATETVDPHDLAKDPVNGDWPGELAVS